MTRSVDDVKQSLPSGLPAIFRPRDLAMQGVAPDYVRTLVRRGEVERLGRGLYRRLDTVIEANETVAAVCARVPDAIVCLLSALRFYEIGTQDPRPGRFQSHSHWQGGLSWSDWVVLARGAVLLLKDRDATTVG